MSHRPLLGALALGVFTAAAAPVASATCDISDTKCAMEGSKCNIKFRNRTGDAGGSGKGQTSSAQTITVKAIRDDSSKAGNKLTIVAGASNTMNFDKKAKNNFEDVVIMSTDLGGTVDATGLTCEGVKAVLNGTGKCKVYHRADHSKTSGFRFSLAVQCDGGNINY